MIEKPMTRKQEALVKLVSTGAPNKVIAHKLGLTVGTVKVYMGNVFRLTNCKNRTELAIWGVRNLD